MSVDNQNARPIGVEFRPELRTVPQKNCAKPRIMAVQELSRRKVIHASSTPSNLNMQSKSQQPIGKYKML
jgi:hypothetical protein